MRFLRRLMSKKPRIVSVEVEHVLPQVANSNEPANQKSKNADELLQQIISMSDISEEAKKKVIEELNQKKSEQI